VLNRYDDSINIINLATGQVGDAFSIGYDPEPSDVKEGRVILYDATLSAHGTVSCATCHRNGERDDLSWDLGDPTAAQPFPTGTGVSPIGGREVTITFHPMKGVMNTQTLRGLAADGKVLINGYSFMTGPALHWRGDRPNSQSGTPMPLTSPLNLMDPFNGAFVSLLGGPNELDATQLQQFNAFVASLIYPPNPNENLDRTYPDAPQPAPSAYRGYLQFISGTATIGDKNVLMQCTACHEVANFGPGTTGLIDPTADASASHPGGVTKQPFKIPQLRNFYKKDGLTRIGTGSTSGFGYGHEGANTQAENINAPNFNFGPTNSQARLDVKQFLLSLDTGTAPSVGFQVTANAGNKNSTTIANQINLLMNQADNTNCDLVVNGIYGGAQQEFAYIGGGNFRNKNGQVVTLQNLLQSVGNGAELTFTGVLYGRGTL
jgi:cytochrome c peroxidase